MPTTRRPLPCNNDRGQLPRHTRLAPAAALISALLLLPLAQAQTAPPQLPSGAEPGREAARPVLPTPGLGAPPLAVPQAPATAAPPGAEQLRFTLTRVQIDGASHFSADSLKPLYAELMGQPISVAQAFGVAQALELRYRNAGFVTTRVVVPQQTVEDGLFRIQVIEGFLSDIVFDAHIGPARAAVERLVAPLKGVRPVSLADIERRLLLANDLAGLTVRATLEPSPDALGGSVLRVGVERRAREMSLSVDTHSSPYLGWANVGGSLAFNAFGERADRVSLNLRSSLETGRSAMAAVGYDALLSGEGLSLNASASLSTSKPQLELQALDVRSQVQATQATLAWPLVRSRLMNVRAVGQLDVREVDTDIAGAAFTRDRLRVLRLGVSVDRADESNGVNAARLTLHQGLDALGAKPKGDPLASRINGRSDFTKFTLDLTRLQQLGARSSLMLALSSQWSTGALLASEEMALGGASFGRGFDDGEIAADSGVAVSLELRHNPGWAWAPAETQLFAFIDGGRLRAHPDGAPLLHARSLTSLGAGVRANLSPSAFGTLELAKPLNTTPRTQGDKHPRLFLRWVQQF